mmetsp:Transcript_54384/g.157245  ORF Transcript_54384/g.157245 Transcript_54384/m.157245 type:complete len:371 (+) Transcript_54384:110-1222(+)
MAPRRGVLAACVAMPAVLARAACPSGGIDMHGKCWYLGEPGASCSNTCKAKGLSFSHFVPGEAAPMVPKLLGREPGTRQFPWGRIECYVQGSDRFHTAKERPDGNTGDKGDAGDWSVDVCRLSCSCAQGPSAPVPPVNPSAPYPGCTEQSTVYRHSGMHAIFVDMSAYGSAGCWQNDCKNTDKFNADDMGICARTCAQVEECTHWSFGEQEEAKKCFFRKSDGGRESADGWVSAPKACAPPAIPDAYQAFAAGELLKACDAGKNEACPDMARAVTTWRYAIRHLKKATEGKVDPNTVNFINQVSDDTDAFAAQMSEDNFPVVVGNNRQVFNALASWMMSTPKPNFDPNDLSLPNPLRGELCGAASCHEKA